VDPVDDATTGSERDVPSRVLTALLVLVAVGFVVLLVTGVWLARYYAPASSWPDAAPDVARHVHRVRQAHRVAARTVVWLTIAAAAVAVGRWWARRAVDGAPAAAIARRRRIQAAWAGIVGAVATVGASITGYLLPWDQLALWSVTIGSDLRGYRAFFDGDKLRFAFVDGHEVSLGAMRTAFVLHVAVLAPGGAAAVAVVARSVWRRPRPPARNAVGEP
jgi:quinol-cytochrome oxidoreductase complex cytochrome b subunit